MNIDEELLRNINPVLAGISCGIVRKMLGKSKENLKLLDYINR
jgi:hypothetical protein